jgi:carbon storage regulator
MLVLTRRPGEWIAIGDEIVVRLLSVKGDQVQIGIEAPREVVIHRGEIREQVLTQMDAARASAKDPKALRAFLESRGSK